MKKICLLIIFTCFGITACAGLGKQMIASDQQQSKAAFDQYNALQPEKQEDVNKSLISYLSSSDPDVKIRAAQTVSSLGLIEAIPDLRIMMNDKNSDVKAAAIKALGLLADNQSTPKIINALGDKDPAVRRAAASALGYMREKKAADYLLRTLYDSDASVVGAAIEALDNIDIEPATLIKLSEDGNAKVRMYAVHALCKTEPQTEETFSALKNRLFDHDTTVASYTATEMKASKIDASYIMKLLSSDRAEIRLFAIEKLGSMGAQARPALSALSRGLTDNSDEICESSAKAMGQIGKDAVPMLMLSMKKNNVKARKYAVKAFGYMGEEAVPYLVRFMSHADASVRRNAAQMLGELGHYAKNDTSVLFKALKDSDANVRLAALEALDKIGFENTEENTAQIEKLLNDPDEHVSQAAGNVLSSAKERGKYPEAEAGAAPALAAPSKDAAVPVAVAAPQFNGIASPRIEAPAAPAPSPTEDVVKEEKLQAEEDAGLFPNGKRKTRPARYLPGERERLGK